MKKFFNEFKEFISKGNVIDLAVGVVIGNAFSKIVSSLVDNIMMPLVGLLLGGVDFSGLSIKFQGASIKYGLFIQNIVDFLIVAFCIFTVIKVMNSFDKKVKDKLKKEEEKKEEKKEPELTKDQELLVEIRDLLKKQEKETKKK